MTSFLLIAGFAVLAVHGVYLNIKLDRAMPNLTDLNTALAAAKTQLAAAQAAHQGVADTLVQVIADLKAAAAQTTNDFTDQIAALQDALAQLEPLVVPDGTIPPAAPATTETSIN